MLLRKGSTGSAVYNLERMLTALDFGGLAIDNEFDEKTENVVKYIQGAHGLGADGIVGPQTWALLQKLSGKAEGFTSSGSAGVAALPKSVTNRKLAGIHPKLAVKAEQTLELAKKDGFELVITQGLRTFAEQDALYRKRPRVTRARGGQSYHNYGIAFDVAFKVNGKISWDEKLYKRIGGWVDAVGGLTWGGRWSFVDLPHIQLQGAPKTASLLADYQRFGGGQKAIEKIWEKYIK